MTEKGSHEKLADLIINEYMNSEKSPWPEHEEEPLQLPDLMDSQFAVS